MEWPGESTGVHVEVSAAWRQRPEHPDDRAQAIPLKTFGLLPHGGPPEIFYLRTKLRPGVYTFVLRYKSPVSVSGVRPILYLADGSSLTVRDLPPLVLNGTRKVVLAKVLLPQGVLWEQDEWFTGRSESADTVTKFRFPDGISWSERKVDTP